jgi:hypothetical protein
MFRPWEEKGADFVRLNAKLEALKGWAALRQYYQRHPPPHPDHYDPNQPRVPAGHPDGGQWTSGGEMFGQERMRAAGMGIAPVPPIRPPRGRERNPIIKEMAKALAKGGIVLAKVFAAAPWLREFHAMIEAYRDPPRSLEELQRAAYSPAPGYDVHHIVEQTPAADDGFSKSTIDAPENLVRISRLKHWEITAWYATKNRAFRNQSPREYLQGRSWGVRRSLGLKVLREFGVLKP